MAMMAKTRDEVRELVRFTDTLRKHGSKLDADGIEALCRMARRHHKLMEHECNRELTDRERTEIARIEETMTSVLSPLPVKFTGDPRGYTVRVMFPDGEHNTWGGAESGYGVPS